MSGPKHLWSGDWERESADSARDRPGPPTPPPDTGENEPVEPSARPRRVRMLAIGALTAIVVIAGGIVLASVLSGSPKHRPRPVASVPNPAAGNTGVPQGNPNGGAGLTPAPGTQTAPTQTTPTTPNAQAPPSTQTAPTQTPPGTGQGNPGTGQVNPGGNQAAPGGGVPPAAQPQPTSTNQPMVRWLGMQIITSPTGAVVNTVQIGSEGDTAGFEPGDVIAEVDGSQIDSARAIRAAVAHVPVGGRIEVQIARGSTLLTTSVTMQGRPTLEP